MARRKGWFAYRNDRRRADRVGGNHLARWEWEHTDGLATAKRTGARERVGRPSSAPAFGGETVGAGAFPRKRLMAQPFPLRIRVGRGRVSGCPILTSAARPVVVAQRRPRGRFVRDGWLSRAMEAETGSGDRPRGGGALDGFAVAAQLRQFSAEGWRKVAELRADGASETRRTGISHGFQCRCASCPDVGRSSAPTSWPHSAARRRQPSRPTARRQPQRLTPGTSQPRRIG